MDITLKAVARSKSETERRINRAHNRLLIGIFGYKPEAEPEYAEYAESVLPAMPGCPFRGGLDHIWVDPKYTALKWAIVETCFLCESKRYRLPVLEGEDGDLSDLRR